jgi:hypothetical protein
VPWSESLARIFRGLDRSLVDDYTVSHHARRRNPVIDVFALPREDFLTPEVPAYMRKG